ncbi:MAG: ATP-binding cassette domain-containing protein [Phycisphaeraceae bacterium]
MTQTPINQTPITLSLERSIQTRADPTPRAMEIAVMFGLSLDGTHEQTIVPRLELELAPRQIVFITGVSGGGKSTLLRLIADAVTPHHLDERARADRPGLVVGDALGELPDQVLVDALARPEAETETEAKRGVRDDEVDADQRPGPASLERVCHWLSLAGLNDAAVMLRRPHVLSEGQRHRLRLAQAMAVAERRPEAWSVLLADEFGSTLDRTTAHGLARSVRRWVSRSDVCLVAATAHDDLLEPLAPDVLVEVAPGGRCDVHRR